jgi:hypothetical protein
MAHRLPIAMALFFTLLHGALSAQSTYKDEKYGYSLWTLKGYNATPVPPTEPYLVSKWTSERRIRDLPSEIHVYVFNRKAPKASEGLNLPDGVEIEGLSPELLEFLSRRGEKTGYAEWIEDNYERRKMKLEKPRPLRVKTAKPREVISAEYYELTRPSGYVGRDGAAADFYVALGIIRTEELEYVVECYRSVQGVDSSKGIFRKVVNSFSLEKDVPYLAALEAQRAQKEKTETPAGATEKSDGYERTETTAKEDSRERAIEECKRNKGWWYYETPRYILVTNLESRFKSYIQELAVRLEGIRDQYEKDFPPAKPITAVSIVRVCENRTSYMAYGGHPSSAGYWYAAAKELVFYKEGGTDTPERVLNHEAFHQYIYYGCGEIAPHSWYNEGYGDYYAGAELAGRRVLRIDPFKWRRDTIREAARNGKHVPMKKILSYSQREYYAKSDLCYAQGWSIIYFLNKGLTSGHPWEAILPTYLQVLQETMSKEKALDAAFKDVDIDAFEQAWIAYTTRNVKAAQP